MEDVVNYFCFQADYQYGANVGFGSEPICTVKRGVECIGISGHMLNIKLSAFLSYYHPRQTKLRYDIEWTCEAGLLYMRVIVKDQGQYISTNIYERGILTPQSIGREYCSMRTETRLLLQKCKKSDSKKMDNMAALLHDQFRLDPSTDGRNPIRSRLLMFFVEKIQSQSDNIGQLSYAENSLLLFWAPYKTIKNFMEYTSHENDEANCRIALSFLSNYCEFMLSLLELHKKGKLNFTVFVNRFEIFWKISLDHILADLMDTSKCQQHKQFTLLFKDKSLSEGLNLAICDCVDAASYSKATRAVKQIYQKLDKSLRRNDPAVISQLDSVERYIKDMNEYYYQTHHRSNAS